MSTDIMTQFSWSSNKSLFVDGHAQNIENDFAQREARLRHEIKLEALEAEHKTRLESYRSEPVIIDAARTVAWARHGTQIGERQVSVRANYTTLGFDVVDVPENWPPGFDEAKCTDAVEAYCVSLGLVVP